jgi:hypothetical protein
MIIWILFGEIRRVQGFEVTRIFNKMNDLDISSRSNLSSVCYTIFFHHTTARKGQGQDHFAMVSISTLLAKCMTAYLGSY